MTEEGVHDDDSFDGSNIKIKRSWIKQPAKPETWWSWLLTFELDGVDVNKFIDQMESMK